MERPEKIFKMEKLFTDTNEGINILYDKYKSEIGVFIWNILNDAGAVEGKIIMIEGTSWDNPLDFRVRISGGDVSGTFWVGDELIGEFRTYDKEEEMITKYVLDFLNEEVYLAE